MHTRGLTAHRAFIFLVCVGVTLVGIACQDSLATAPSSSATAELEGGGPPADPSSSPASPTAADLAGFTCSDLEEVRVRFGAPGFIRDNEVAVYAGFFGAPDGDKYLRIYWDFKNEPETFQIVDTQAGQVRRDNDALFDIEEVVEHTYDGVSGTTERTVRVELIHEEGNSRLCARNRDLTVQPPPTRAGASVCASHPQWQPVSCRTGEWVWSSNRAFTSLASANAQRTLWTGAKSIPNTCSLDGSGWVSTSTSVLSGCSTDWFHIGGRFTGDCSGWDGSVVRRLVLGPNDCYDY